MRKLAPKSSKSPKVEALPSGLVLPTMVPIGIFRLPDTELPRALYGLESLFLPHGACQHAYLGTWRVSWVSLAPLWRYAGANAAILVEKLA